MFNPFTLLLLPLLAPTSTTPPVLTPPPTWWTPSPNTTWTILLSSPPHRSLLHPSTTAYDTDLFATSPRFIAAAHAAGHRSICYFSAGSWERWRPDAGEFPDSVLGKPLAGWPGERWLNVSAPVVRRIMAARMERGRVKGCDAVDPDNVDGYDNDNGLGLTKGDAVEYVRWLAREAHKREMGVSLKNAGAVVESVVKGHGMESVDFSVNEQCVRYRECGVFRRFLEEGKPVFHIEYVKVGVKGKMLEEKVKHYCDAKGDQGFQTLVKHLDLGPWERRCPAET